MPRGNQLTRQWHLLQLLDRPAGVAVDEAARDLDCRPDDLARPARPAGRRIPYDEQEADGRRSVWRVDDTFKQRLPLKLSLSELTALLMSRDLLAPSAAGGLGPAATSAFEKIGSVLSQDALGLIDRMRDTIGVRTVGAKLQAPAAEHVAAIQGALVDRRQLRLRYYSMSRDDVSDRRVDLSPGAPRRRLLSRGVLPSPPGRAHLRGRAHPRVRGAGRALRQAQTFDVDEYLEGAWGIIRGDIVTVKVLFARPLARYIRERLWLATQTFCDRDGGQLEMTLRVADTLEVRRWIWARTRRGGARAAALRGRSARCRNPRAEARAPAHAADTGAGVTGGRGQSLAGAN
jgi:hypothetical protein